MLLRSESLLIDLNDYFYFVHVVEKQGFSAAADALNMPKSRLSRHIKQLEERLDVRLIQRTSRQFNITDIGKIFYQHARSAIDEMEAAESAVKNIKSTLSGRVSLSCSLGVAQFLLKELLIRFLIDNPKVEVVQQVTNQAIDLVAEGVDVAVRGHTYQLPDSSLVQRKLALVPWYLFAGTNYLEKYGAPTSLDDLAKRQGLKVGWQSSEGCWSLQNQQGVHSSVPFHPQLCSDDMTTLKTAAIRGLGIVALPAYICREEIAAGTLQCVLPEWKAGTAQLSLLMPSRQGVAPPVQALIEFLLSKTQAFVETGEIIS